MSFGGAYVRSGDMAWSLFVVIQILYTYREGGGGISVSYASIDELYVPKARKYVYRTCYVCLRCYLLT